MRALINKIQATRPGGKFTEGQSTSSTRSSDRIERILADIVFSFFFFFLLFVFFLQGHKKLVIELASDLNAAFMSFTDKGVKPFPQNWDKLTVKLFKTDMSNKKHVFAQLFVALLHPQTVDVITQLRRGDLLDSDLFRRLLPLLLLDHSLSSRTGVTDSSSDPDATEPRCTAAEAVLKAFAVYAVLGKVAESPEEQRARVVLKKALEEIVYGGSSGNVAGAGKRAKEHGVSSLRIDTRFPFFPFFFFVSRFFFYGDADSLCAMSNSPIRIAIRCERCFTQPHSAWSTTIDYPSRRIFTAIDLPSSPRRKFVIKASRLTVGRSSSSRMRKRLAWQPSLLHRQFHRRRN